MFSITGQVITVFKAPEGKTKTGENYGGDYRVQVLGELALKNGEVKRELVTLSMPSRWGRELFTAVGSTVTLPVGIMASGNVVRAFIPENTEVPKQGFKQDQKRTSFDASKS
jgi:hypothetical protein